jgi:hypothetical protein
LSENRNKFIGLIVGREKDWPEAFLAVVAEERPDVTAELVKLGGTYMDDETSYAVLIDRMSHEVPYYRTFVKYAAMQGCYVINSPFVWSADNRFFGTAVANRLGLRSPRTIVLPNKDVDTDVVPDSFRNLQYPMDWEGITAYIGVPAIFKEISSGGRRLSYRVHSVDDLIQRYDESGTRTMILQEIIQGGDHIHCLVIGGKDALLLPYDPQANHYNAALELAPGLAAEIENSALAITNSYGYDINMVEFIQRGDELFVINSTNPAPIIDKELMTGEQFAWAVSKTAILALDRLENPPSQKSPFVFENST